MNNKKKWYLTFLVLVILLFVSGISVQAADMSRTAIKISVKRSGCTVKVSWSKRKNASGYQVYLYNSNGKLLKKEDTTKTSVSFKELDMQKTYHIRVRGYQKKGSKKIYTKYSAVSKVSIPYIQTKSTLKKLLQTALQPVGSTLYVWGGGWNEADTGAGEEAVTIGVSPQWKSFFEKQNKNYDYHTTRYQIHDGLDCSGYIGWCIYNIMNTKSGKKGYVMSASKMAKNFSNRGWGTYTSKGKVKNYRAGDIMSSSGHVWMVVGQCSDGSVVMLHASPPGVQLCGTPSRTGKANSKAVSLAKKYMKKYFPQYYKKYPNCARGSSYLTDYAQMRWNVSGTSVMSDPDGYRNMTADQILKDLF